MDRLHAHVQSHKSHQAAAAAITATAKAELATDVAPPRKARPTVLTSPVRTRSNTAETRPRRRSSGVHGESALETLLQNLAVTLPSDGTKPQSQIAYLEKVLAERTRKCNDVEKGAQESFEIAAHEQLEDARRAVQLLRDSLLAETPFGDVKLVDPELEGSIMVLSQEVDKAKEKLSSCEGQTIMARSEKREDFIQRWGS